MISKNVVIVGLQATDSPIGSNCVNIAHELARTGHRVLYINYPFDTRSLLNQLFRPTEQTPIRMEVLKGKTEERQKIADNLHAVYPRVVNASIGFLPDGNLFDFFNRMNNKKLARLIQRHLSALDMKEFILFNDSDMVRSFYLNDLLNPVCSVYYSRDNLISQPYFARHGKRLEAQLIAKSDLAVANSLYLADYCRQFNPNSHYVGQGCETDLFKYGEERVRPKDMPQFNKPVIGYIGALLKLRLDVTLLEELAQRHPEWQFVFVGPEDEAFEKSTLHAFDNVLFTGPKKPAELPAYLNCFDVAINPQELNEMTIGNYPRKIDEYLAMGKPVVATMTRAMVVFEEFVYLAESAEEYSTHIQKALDEDTEVLRKKRSDFALSHTWEASTKEILAAVEKAIGSAGQEER
ncbi:MAG: Putative teichuronic acid biosynthesis glycosyltransferase TuaH [Flavobacteriia bacterium]|nr:MAG: Putative teichuronic acid biosynthesis glycosyltransferase TuaH [Flavobacteriia bacterium]